MSSSKRKLFMFDDPMLNERIANRELNRKQHSLDERELLEEEAKRVWNERATEFDNKKLSKVQEDVCHAARVYYSTLKDGVTSKGRYELYEVRNVGYAVNLLPPSLKTNSLALAWVIGLGGSDLGYQELFPRNIDPHDKKVVKLEPYTNEQYGSISGTFEPVLVALNYLLRCSERTNGRDSLVSVRATKPNGAASGSIYAETKLYKISIQFDSKPERPYKLITTQWKSR
jgi:hypothetical protein